MKITDTGNDIVIHGAENFNLEHIFECGQCFRWNKLDANTYLGVAYGKPLRVSQNGDMITFHSTSMHDYQYIWRRYFDIDRDYGAIQAQLQRQGVAYEDAVMPQAIRHGGGIRILAQEPFEALISFIISANNNIPRIKLIVERLCMHFGDTAEYEGEIYYTFPSAERLAQCSLADLEVIRAGFRAKYILDAAAKVASGEIAPEPLRDLDYTHAKAELLKIKGVGDKVANCIVLFGLGHYSAFPVDVWVRRIVEHCYFGGSAADCDIAEFARERFGEYGGFAQQYLFYYARELKIER